LVGRQETDSLINLHADVTDYKLWGSIISLEDEPVCENFLIFHAYLNLIDYSFS
jgi:hypothetical protein